MLRVHSTYGAAEDIIIVDEDRKNSYMPHLDIGLSLEEAKKLVRDLNCAIHATEQFNSQIEDLDKMNDEAIARGENPEG